MAEITSTTGNWRVTAIGPFGAKVQGLGDHSGTIQNIALALASTASHLHFAPIDPKPVSANELTATKVSVTVQGLNSDELKARIDADIADNNLDMATEIDPNIAAVEITVGLTEESAAQLNTLVTANIALSRLTQEQRDALVATHLLCPVPGGA